MSIAAAFAADKETAFRPPPAESMAHRQSSQQVTVGVEAYTTAAQTKAAFGKLDPNQYGVLPVLVVIQNDSPQTIDAARLQAQFLGPGRDKVENTPAPDVKYVVGPRKPNYIPGPTGGIAVLRGKKNPLDVWEIEGRAFAAKMIPPGKTASGFFYFQADVKPGARIYLNGLTESATGKELFYFEIPLE